MNRIILFQTWLRSNEIKIFFLYASVFFLPLNMKLNNIFLGFFIFIYIIEGSYVLKWFNIKKNYIDIFSIAILFLVIGISAFYSEYTRYALRQIERSIPFIAVPIIFLSQPDMFAKKKKLFFYSLSLGCLLAALICWSFLLYNLIINDEIYRIFTWRYTKLNLIKPIDQHTPYLSMFLFTSIGFLVSSPSSKRKHFKAIKYLVISILMIFMFQLLSRTAIIYFLLATIIYLLFKKNFKLLILFLSFVSIFILTLLSSNEDKNNYFDKLFMDQLGLNGIEKVDKRFERWKYSYELFKENSIFGKGMGDVDVYRAIKFRENQDIEGYKNKFNAHNQFFEFISGQGLIGVLAFLFSFFFLIRTVYINKEYLYFYILLGIFCCSMTESIFRVSWGIVFFSLISSFSLVSCLSSSRHHSNSNCFRVGG